MHLNNPMKSEIFRHVRPHWVNKARKTIDPLPHGGISFLFLTSGEDKSYDYWIYICPDDAIFSARVAAAKLRQVAASGVKPWGNISLSSSSILDEAIKSVLAEEDELPTEVALQLFEIMLTNFGSQHLLDTHVKNASRATSFYE